VHEDRPQEKPRETRAAAAIVVLAVVSVGVAQGFGRFSYPLLLPAIDADLLHSYARAGFLGTANLTAYLLGTLCVSLAAGRVDPPRLMRIGLCCGTLGLAILYSAGGFLALLAGLLLTGFGGAFIWIPAPGFVGSIVRPERRGAAIGFLGSGIGLSIVASSQLTGAVRSYAGPTAWREVWGIEAIAAGLVTLVAMRWLRADKSGFAPLRVRLSALREVPGWVGLTLAYSAYGLSYSLFMSYLVAALERDAGFSPRHAASVFALVGGAIVFGGVILGRISDRLGRGRTMLVGFTLWGGCALGVLVGREPWVTIAAIVFGLLMSGLGSVIAAHIADHLDPRSFGAAFGAVTLCFGVAQLVGPQLGGWIAERTGSFALAFWISAGASFAGAIAAATIPPARRP
jgi:predicted MFS family arabinose efflux permease